MKKVALLTNYRDYLKSFSPLILAGDQVKMLKKNGYEPVVIATDGFSPPKDSPFNLAELRFTPPVRIESDFKSDPDFDKDVDILRQSIEKHLKDIDVVITHDLLYLPDYMKHNLASRQVAEKNPKLRWLHWIHSSTPPDQLAQERQIYPEKYKDQIKPFPNSFIVYPNSYDIPRVARSFDVEESLVKHCPHPIDYSEYMKFETITKKLINDKNMLQADVISVYPLRLDRGKQPHVNVEIMAEIKSLGFSVRMIFIDFHSTGGDKVTYREEMKNDAVKLGLNADELIFTSEFDKEIELEAPRSMVSDLFSLSNVFILPSMSETYSLIAQEALIKGNLLVLNHDFPAMRSIYGDHAIYRKFSANVDIFKDVSESQGKTETTYGDKRGYMGEIARKIVSRLKEEPYVAQTEFRKKRNLDSVFRNYIEPLINWSKD